MSLNRVTFTGADDSVTGADLRQFTKGFNDAYPDRMGFLEWGLLVSVRQEGTARFPSRNRLREFVTALDGCVDGCDAALSMHVCGHFVREICVGNWKPLVDHYGMDLMNQFDRIQLNFHAITHTIAAPAFFDAARKMIDTLHCDLILQFDGVNDHILGQCEAVGIEAAPLFDTSGGAGIVPGAWDMAIPGLYCGYAGGLGPETITTELPKIAAAAGTQDYWIDMETRVRRDHDRLFDLDACQAVLDAIEPEFLADTANSGD